MVNFGSSKEMRKLISVLLNMLFFLLFIFYTTTNYNSSSSGISPEFKVSTPGWIPDDCSGVHNFTDYESRCEFVKSHVACKGKGYINYLQIFYCNCSRITAVGYTLLLIWLLVLFYVVGNTTADYFCPSVEQLSRILKLSPTIAGTTLLPFGNGANDVFASIISFTRSHDSDVGFSSVLGGAFFITCFVVGIVSISISSRRTTVDEGSFIRDVLFFIFSLISLMMIIIYGRINLLVSVSYVCIYFCYIGLVCAMQLFYGKKERIVNPPAAVDGNNNNNNNNIYAPLMEPGDDEETGESQLLLQNVCDHGCCSEKEQPKKLFGFSISQEPCRSMRMFLSVLELPLYLPRRLTIPVVSEERWSKTYAVISAILAPIFLAIIWNSQFENMGHTVSLAIFLTATLFGIILGNFAFSLTDTSTAPKECLLPWLAGGFIMSITWTYLIASELVSLLVSFGIIFGINPSILALTVLAWGNSAGDLISNVAMALKGGPDGVQMAISGCYAGPLFNTLIGLGLSLVFASWSEYPASYVIPRDPYLYEIVGFLIAGLLWAVVILLKRNMRLDSSLGAGLLAIYFCFLFLRFSKGL
ncbi:OLC1v1037029C1 [Oldenlandia corymbosa var. corymbosa]|uniref:OLC1v1037029C1 n=1 Tax=Oldenlandia corymbosa var. corymbosa TaxID=529605 RepID=A0AAV1CWL3_OLDCO|nr:OLC1v1037029C1 [Oldenlandia corymbosa var. corymbosa]